MHSNEQAWERLSISLIIYLPLHQSSIGSLSTIYTLFCCSVIHSPCTMFTPMIEYKCEKQWKLLVFIHSYWHGVEVPHLCPQYLVFQSRRNFLSADCSHSQREQWSSLQQLSSWQWWIHWPQTQFWPDLWVQADEFILYTHFSYHHPGSLALFQLCYPRPRVCLDPYIVPVFGGFLCLWVRKMW